MSINDKRATQERIWKIRDSIQELEDLKDEILKYYESDSRSDQSSYGPWITDIKECYYSIVSAWEMLRAVSDGKKNYIESCNSYLFLAKRKFSQVSSELKALKEKYLDKLNQSLTMIFNKCYELILTELKNLTPEEKLEKPEKRIIKISNQEYELPCSVCSKICINFRIGITDLFTKEGLLYTGITHQTSLNLKYANKVFSLLEDDNIAELHNFLESSSILEEGLDAYCPKCDKVYCWEHFNAYEEYDDGFYDCTYAECPEGHKRMIDD